MFVPETLQIGWEPTRASCWPADSGQTEANAASGHHLRGFATRLLLSVGRLRLGEVPKVNRNTIHQRLMLCHVISLESAPGLSPCSVEQVVGDSAGVERAVKGHAGQIVVSGCCEQQCNVVGSFDDQRSVVRSRAPGCDSCQPTGE